MPEPTRVRKVIAALVTALIVVAVWWFIEWRSSPPMTGP